MGFAFAYYNTKDINYHPLGPSSPPSPPPPTHTHTHNTMLYPTTPVRVNKHYCSPYPTYRYIYLLLKGRVLEEMRDVELKH